MSEQRQLGSSGNSKTTMHTLQTLAIVTVLALTGFAGRSLGADEQDGVALAIIYDTSGSMGDRVQDRGGQPAPKYLIADRALVAVAQHIQSYASNTNAGPVRPIHTGLFIFEGERAKEVLRFGPFEGEALKNWAEHFTTPKGNTPLGNALTTASQKVLASPLSRKHVLVITDGMNTAGPPPVAVLPRLKRQAEAQHTTLSVHFIAFDVDAKLFEPLKKLGATVVSASNEEQLNSQLQFILERKILLEEEEKK